MVTQHILKPNPGAHKHARSIGRGDGSGRGSFSGRGCKGQSARSGGKVKPGFEGGQTPLIRRIPKFKGFRNPGKMLYQVVNLSDLEVFENGQTIDLVALYEKGMISKKTRPVKVLGTGTLSKKFVLKVDAISSSAREKIESAGGTVTVSMKEAPAAK